MQVLADFSKKLWVNFTHEEQQRMEPCIKLQILGAAKQHIQQAVVSACTLLTVCKDWSCNPLWIAATETRASVNLLGSDT